MDFRSLKTHQERKDTRKTRQAQVKKLIAQPQVKPLNRKSANPKRGTPDTRRTRNPQPARYIGHRQSPSKTVRLQIKAMREQFIQRARDLQELKQLQNKLEMTQEDFLSHCEEKLTEEEFKWTLQLMNPQQWQKRFGEEPSISTAPEEQESDSTTEADTTTSE